MNTLRYYLHEWHMRWKIRRILAYNRKHPEECFNLEDYIKTPLQSRQGTLTTEHIRQIYERES